MPESLTCTLRRRVYASPETLFAVFEAESRPGAPSLRVVGPLADLEEGEHVEVVGEWVDDPRFGRQFRAQVYHTVPPRTRAGIIEYLASKRFKGVGPRLAERIVDTLGDDALTILKEEPGRVHDIPGVGPAKARAILEQLERNRPVEEALVFLRGVGLGEVQASRVLKGLGPGAPARIKRNPYELIGQVEGIGFRRADVIASHLGVAPDSPFRIRAGLAHLLEEDLDQGHLFTPDDQLVERGAALLEADPDRVETLLEQLVAEGALVAEDDEAGAGRRVSLRRAIAAEREVARRLAQLAATPSPLGLPRGDALGTEVERLAARFGMTLDPLQRQALVAALGRKVAVITGGPGTGKTTILRVLIRILDERSIPVALAAPTGRASKRLSEACRREARTLHRLLEFYPGTGGFRRGRDLPLDEPILVVDEASMIDVFLLRDVVRALRPEAHLVLIGDSDQLPSVGPGAILRDLIASEVVPVVALTRIYRQERGGLLVRNAHRVNRGELPEVPGRNEPLSDFYQIERESPREIRAALTDLLLERIPTRFGLDPAREIQVITPMYRGDLGLDELNPFVQRLLNPAARERRPEGVRFVSGDKVMQIRNDYEREVFNGDIGFVTRSGRDGVAVRFDERVVEYAPGEDGDLVLAYAISVHKSQGSEFPAVILPLHPQHAIMLRRNLLYTALTRARRLAVIVGSPRALSMAVRRNPERGRRTRLAERLQREWGGPAPDPREET